MSQVPEKRKIQPTVKETVITGWGCLLAGIMLALGFTVGVGASIYFVPHLMGFNATSTALAQREAALKMTEADLGAQGEAARATEAALGNNSNLLNQTATQSQLNIYATQTVAAVEGERRQTQVALDWEATQAQLERNATQVEIDFRNTQAALGIGVASSVTESPLSLSTVYNHNFAQGILSSAWRSSSSDDWALTDGGVWAQRKGAWLLSNALYGDKYSYHVTFDPVLLQDSDYFFLIGVTGDEGIVVHIHAENLESTEVAFYRFVGSLNQTPIDISQMEKIESIAYTQILQSQSQVRIDINGESVALHLDDQAVLSVIVPDLKAGAVGLQLPQNALLRNISVEVD